MNHKIFQICNASFPYFYQMNTNIYVSYLHYGTNVHVCTYVAIPPKYVYMHVYR